MKTVIIFILATLLSVNCYSQGNINDIFKSVLVLNGTITLKENNPIKKSELETIITSIDLETSELKSDILSPLFFYDYKIYKFDFNTDKINFRIRFL